MPVVEPLDATSALVDGRKTMLFWAITGWPIPRHPRVLAASKEATDRFGASATASRLINGNHRLYNQLEEELADLKGTETALVFSKRLRDQCWDHRRAWASSRDDWIFMGQVESREPIRCRRTVPRRT